MDIVHTLERRYEWAFLHWRKRLWVDLKRHLIEYQSLKSLRFIFYVLHISKDRWNRNKWSRRARDLADSFMLGLLKSFSESKIKIVSVTLWKMAAEKVHILRIRRCGWFLKRISTHWMVIRSRRSLSIDRKRISLYSANIQRFFNDCFQGTFLVSQWRKKPFKLKACSEKKGSRVFVVEVLLFF